MHLTDITKEPKVIVLGKINLIEQKIPKFIVRIYILAEYFFNKIYFS